ncbi:MAG TPA: EscU/YscU/HrcU family type III secretion system export apparatus switch protein [Firmicutes bacterium]|nr:EscU/YscU/HrcU family type III secretion system export apparatus switch protein [Bacillota bacterium]
MRGALCGRVVHLQLFAEDREFPATPRKRQEARRRGQVFRSAEATAAAVIVGTLLVVRWVVPRAAEAWQEMFYALWGKSLPDLTGADLHLVLIPALKSLAVGVLPVMAAALGIGLVVDVAQVGVLFTSTPLAPDLGRLDPFKGLARLFSRRALVELAKGALKVAIVGYVCYQTIAAQQQVLARLALASLGDSLHTAGEILTQLVSRAGVGFALLAAADWYYQRWEYEAGLRMSRQEMKEEFRQTEGNPELRARIKRRQREIASYTMLADVADADVVVRNPTTYAVALRYDPGRMQAPMVVARGKGHLAQRIIAEARKHWVMVVENRSLAQSLYRLGEVGKEIPPQLYQAVAEVLAFVYRVSGRRVEED